MISKAMQGGDISLIEFNKVLQEIEKYRKLKAEKGSQAKNYVRQITKMQQQEFLQQGRKKDKQGFFMTNYKYFRHPGCQFYLKHGASLPYRI